MSKHIRSRFDALPLELRDNKNVNERSDVDAGLENQKGKKLTTVSHGEKEAVAEKMHLDSTPSLA